MVQEIILNNHFKKAYAEEDEIKRKAAEIRRQAEAEKERQRQLRREQNPDGIVGDVSKKKLRQQEKEAAEKAAREYEAKSNPQGRQRRGQTPLRRRGSSLLQGPRV